MSGPQHNTAAAPIAFGWDNILDLAANAIAGSWRIPVPTTVLANCKWGLRRPAPMRTQSGATSLNSNLDPEPPFWCSCAHVKQRF
jgi:hypothetical protein